MKKFLLIGLLAILAIFLIIQLVPFGRQYDNPPILQEPQWPSPESLEIARRACFDCHSHETVWPWYSKIAPVSWLIIRDVQNGREHLNFSDWSNAGHDAEEIGEVIFEGEMPLLRYTLLHPEARLTAAERQILARALAAVAPATEGLEHDHDHDHDD